MAPLARTGKYNAHRVRYAGFTFDSQAECDRYIELTVMRKAGVIEGEIKVHPVYNLQQHFCYNGKVERAITYVADFEYKEVGNLRIVVEDVKGVRTEVYRLKRKLFLYLYGDRYDFRELSV